MVEKLENLIEKEIEFIEQSIISKEFADKFIFLVNRLYHNFKRGSLVYQESDFLNIFGNEELHKVIMPKLKILENLYIQFSEKDLVNFSSSNIVLLNNKQYLSLSPFFYSEKLLKDIITHELSILDLNERDNIIKKVICVFDELKIRLGLSFAWDAINEKYRHYQLFEELEVWQEEEFDYETKEKHLVTHSQTSYGEFEDQYIEAGFLGVKDREAIDLNELINWLENIQPDKIKKNKIVKVNKIEYIESNYKIFKIIVAFFENNQVKLSGNRKEQIKFFINNVGETNPSKNLICKNENTIDFFSTKTFKSFLALLVYLDGKGKIKFKDNLYLYNILISELKNKKISISNRHRDFIGKFKDFSLNDLEAETNFSI